MDTNEHVMGGAMCRHMTGEDLQMSEVVHSKTKGPGPKTWFRGSESIDEIWVSSKINVTKASYLPFDGFL